MFPISNDGVFEDLSTLLEPNTLLEDLLADCPIPEVEGNENGVKKRPRKAEENSNGSKKSAHRSIEKQRRQEMSALCASLRSLLPLEYIKGKRAVSDHMHQAVNYINDMKKKMEELQKRKDELRQFSSNNVATTSANVVDDPNTNANGGDFLPCVKINLFKDAMEILISSNLNFPLSKLLAELLDRKLNVINCVSTTASSTYLHKIHIQLNESTSIDLLELQERLQNLIRFA